jgi:hypothetical protein
VIGYIRLTADYSRLVSGLAPSPIAGVRALTRVHAWSGMCRYTDPTPVPTTETSAEALPRLFLAPKAPLGKTWLTSTGNIVSNESLHCLVMASTVPPIAKARNMYGHFRTASQMNKVSGIYWKPDAALKTYLQQEPLRLNPHPLQPKLERLQSLYSDTVGSILLVTKQFHPDGTASPAYITIVTAPALAPLGPFSAEDPPGITISDYWDESVLAPYSIKIGDSPHCPMLAATEGFSRLVNLPGTSDFLNDSQPLLFPLGEHMASQIQTPTGAITRAFFLPEVCNIPLGMT